MANLLGCKPRIYRPSVPHLSSTMMMALAQPPIPANEDWFKGLPQDVGMMLNDRLGCCTIAGLYHYLQTIIFATTGQFILFPDTMIMQAYEEACDYNPADPNTDQGGIEQNVLAYAMNPGLPTPWGRHKIMAWGEIDPRNIDDVKRVIAECGYCYIGIRCLNSWTGAPAGSVLEFDNSGVEGLHCVGLGGYSDDPDPLLNVVTWGNAEYRMPKSTFDQVCKEAYYLIDEKFVGSTGKTPFGLPVPVWQASMQAEQMINLAAA
jgi:hypothetical protein